MKNIKNFDPANPFCEMLNALRWKARKINFIFNPYIIVKETVKENSQNNINYEGFYIYNSINTKDIDKFPDNRKYMASSLGENNIIISFECDGRVLGFVVLKKRTHVVYDMTIITERNSLRVTHIYVDNRHRNKKIGEKLKNFVYKYMSDNNMMYQYYMITTFNKESIFFHKKFDSEIMYHNIYFNIFNRFHLHYIIYKNRVENLNYQFIFNEPQKRIFL